MAVPPSETNNKCGYPTTTTHDKLSNSASSSGSSTFVLYDVPLLDNKSMTDEGTMTKGFREGDQGDDVGGEERNSGCENKNNQDNTFWSPDSTDFIREVRKDLLGDFDASTSSDEDDNDAGTGKSTNDGEDPPDYFATFLGSMTAEQKKDMMDGLESYMVGKQRANTSSTSGSFSVMIESNNDTPSFSEISSTDRLLFCGEQDLNSLGYHDGDHSRFEPDSEVLEKVRRKLFQ